jgi:hypothetical protein
VSARPTAPALDHLVVAADTLADGVAWCEAVLGVTPAPGGAHALFGTHNRLLRLDGADHAYLEIIAIDPAATPTRAAPLRRWFDLDDPVLRHRLRSHGPRLIHWVARVADAAAAAQALRARGIERGPLLAASRATPHGELRWRLTVRDDGQRLFGGALPTLIAWDGPHPAASLPAQGVALRGLRLAHVRADGLRGALQTLGFGLAGEPGADDAVSVAPNGPALTATLDTPRGPVTLTA